MTMSRRRIYGCPGSRLVAVATAGEVISGNRASPVSRPATNPSILRSLIAAYRCRSNAW